MRVPVRFDGNGFVLDLDKAVEDIANLSRRLSKRHNDRRITDFVTTRNFMTRHRRLLSFLAASYYKSQHMQTLDQYVPLLVCKGWIPENPVDLTENVLEWRLGKPFAWDQSFYRKTKLFSKNRQYVELLKELFPNMTLFDSPTYRVLKITGNPHGAHLTFGLDWYFSYMNTCELLAFEFCHNIVILAEKRRLTERHLLETHFPLREKVHPFDFENRSAAGGVSTLLMVLGGKSKPKMFIHERSDTAIAEALNTLHVVPSGTFQPRHADDGFHDLDFSLRRNIMRELAEELLGQDEWESVSRTFHDILDTEPLKKFWYLIKIGQARMFYLGVGLDCLTTKPEILTALVVKQDAMDVLLGDVKFRNNFEGKFSEVSLSRGSLKRYVEDDRMFPSGGACMALVNKHFDFFINLFN